MGIVRRNSMALRMFTSRAAPALRRSFATEAASTKLSLNFVLPSGALYENAEVDMVTVPATNGIFAIMKDHIPTIAQLDAGIVNVSSADGEDKFFISGGFAVVKEDGASVCAVEAIRVEDLDEPTVNAGVTEATAQLASATDDTARAEAQISLSTYMAMQAAIGAK